MRSLLFRAGLVLLIAVALVAICERVGAYMSIRVPVGSPAEAESVRWNLSSTRSNLANRRVLYEIGDSGCADRALFTGGISEFQAIQDSFNRWRGIRESEIDFEFTGSTTSEVTSASDNRNVIRFVGSNITAGVFAVTITTFDTTTGEILDADMELNDRDFTWDTLGPTNTTGTPGRAYIENVVTHEIGHLIGFDHPGNSRSTLFYASSAGLINQVSLERDDVAQAISDYPHAGLTDPSLGIVQGSVTDSTSAGQFGVGVVLLDVATGRNVIGHVSEKPPGLALGGYEIKGVPPGNYLAFALPVSASQLGSYYSGAFTTFFPVARGVAVNTAGAPTLVKVAPGATVSGANISLPAAGPNPFEPNGTSATATPISSGQVAVAQISPAADVDFFSFTATAGQVVVIRALSDAFGFNLNPTLTLLDTNGTTVLVSPVSSHPAFNASASDRDANAYDLTGSDLDAEISFALPSAGTFFFAVASRAGVTAGQYLLTFELQGADTSADSIATRISSSVPGVPANGTSTFTVNVEPRNLFGRALAAPNTYTVDLVDRTGAPTVLQTITTASAPFSFTVTALASAATRTYGCRVNGADMSASVTVSHYGSLSAANSRITLLETSLVANGYDSSLVLVELRDGANNAFVDGLATVSLTTSLGALSNGTVSGGTVSPVFDAARKAWVATLVTGTSIGTASVSATANSVSIAPKDIQFLQAAAGTGSSQGATTPKKEEGGGCTTGQEDARWAGALLLVLLAIRLRARRRAAP